MSVCEIPSSPLLRNQSGTPDAPKCFETYLHTSLIHFHFAQCQNLVRRLVHELNEQVSSYGVRSAPQSQSSGRENTVVVVTHLMCQRVWARGEGGQCVCQADSEVVQTFCSGARCRKNTILQMS